MLKIAIITLDGHGNYGNRLQNYALQEFLKSLSEVSEVKTIWYEKNTYLPEVNIFNKKNILKYIINRNDMRKYIEYDYAKDCIREYNIKKFSDKFIDIKYDYNIKSNLNEEYDYFIVGSDQVWNPYYEGYFKEKFLQFAPSSKRIAYAASFGVTDIPKEKELLFKKVLLDMKEISVRENEGKKIVGDLINKDVSVLVDPTLLLTKEKWQKIQKKPEWYNEEKYILTYFLGKEVEILKSIAKRKKLKIINLMDKSNIDIYVSRVEEFIYLINNAELVCTDSFHGTVFSIILNTPFLSIRRNDEMDMNSRLSTLLSLFKFKDRYIVDGKCNFSDEEILHMDFSNVKAIQEREIERSTVYMKKALNLEQV